MMSLITVDKLKCTKCGKCSEQCSEGVIQIGKDGPVAIAPQNCFSCGHCTAVCPFGAIDNVRAPKSKQIDIDKNILADSHHAEIFLRSRRSVRGFKKEPVSHDTLLKLVEITRYAPTASNSQGISFRIVEDTKIVRKAASLAIAWIESIPSSLSNPYYIEAYHKQGIDTILRGAPHLILATTSAGFSSGRETFFTITHSSMPTPAANFVGGRENSIFKLAYMELYAPSLGLGSCWAGIMEMCINSGYPPLLDLFQLDEGEKITGVVMVGYPKYHFHRLVEREPLNATFI